MKLRKKQVVCYNHSDTSTNKLDWTWLMDLVNTGTDEDKDKQGGLSDDEVLAVLGHG